jgi:hypothetical protein
MKWNKFQTCIWITMLSFFMVNGQVTDQPKKLPGDNEIRQKIVGTWIPTWATNCIIVFTSDDKFVAPPFEGTWQIKDGIWISTITQCSLGKTNYSMNNIEHFKVIRVNDHEFEYESGDQKMLLKRKENSAAVSE